MLGSEDEEESYLWEMRIFTEKLGQFIWCLSRPHENLNTTKQCTMTWCFTTWTLISLPFQSFSFIGFIGRKSYLSTKANWKHQTKPIWNRVAKKIGIFKIKENIECQSQIIDCLLHFYQDKSDYQKKKVLVQCLCRKDQLRIYLRNHKKKILQN